MSTDEKVPVPQSTGSYGTTTHPVYNNKSKLSTLLSPGRVSSLNEFHCVRDDLDPKPRSRVRKGHRTGEGSRPRLPTLRRPRICGTDRPKRVIKGYTPELLGLEKTKNLSKVTKFDKEITRIVDRDSYRGCHKDNRRLGSKCVLRNP